MTWNILTLYCNSIKNSYGHNACVKMWTNVHVDAMFLIQPLQTDYCLLYRERQNIYIYVNTIYIYINRIMFK